MLWPRHSKLIIQLLFLSQATTKLHAISFQTSTSPIKAIINNFKVFSATYVGIEPKSASSSVQGKTLNHIESYLHAIPRARKLGTLPMLTIRQRHRIFAFLSSC